MSKASRFLAQVAYPLMGHTDFLSDLERRYTGSQAGFNCTADQVRIFEIHRHCIGDGEVENSHNFQIHDLVLWLHKIVALAARLRGSNHVHDDKWPGFWRPLRL